METSTGSVKCDCKPIGDGCIHSWKPPKWGKATPVNERIMLDGYKAEIDLLLMKREIEEDLSLNT